MKKTLLIEAIHTLITAVVYALFVHKMLDGFETMMILNVGQWLFFLIHAGRYLIQNDKKM